MFTADYRGFRIKAYQSFIEGQDWVGELVYDVDTPVWSSSGHANSVAAAAAVERRIDAMIEWANDPKNIAAAFAESEIVPLVSDSQTDAESRAVGFDCGYEVWVTWMDEPVRSI